MLDESDTDGKDCCRLCDEWSGREGAVEIRSPVNARYLRLECAMMLHEGLLAPVLTTSVCGSEVLVRG